MTQRILVVDDERYVRTLLERTLDPFEDVNVELVFASDAEEAFALARDARPSLAIVDARLPHEAGYELCARLRALAGGESIVLVLLAEMGQQVDAAKCQDLGITDVIAKPFDPDRVRLMAGEALHINVEL